MYPNLPSIGVLAMRAIAAGSVLMLMLQCAAFALGAAGKTQDLYNLCVRDEPVLPRILGSSQRPNFIGQGLPRSRTSTGFRRGAQRVFNLPNGDSCRWTYTPSTFHDVGRKEP